MFPFPFGFIGSGEVIPDLELISNDYAMEFNGTDEYVNAGSTSYLDNATKMSFSVWFNFDTAADNTGILGDNTLIDLYTKNASGSNYTLRLNLNGNANRFQLTGTPFTAGQWHNIVVTFNAGSLNFYVDGSSAAYTVYSGAIPASLSGSTGQLEIGRAYSSSTTWNGDIDEVAIWNEALELADAQTIYNSTNDNPGKCANLFTGGLGSGLVFWNRMGD